MAAPISYDTALMLLRVVVGALFIYHGSGKVFGDMGAFNAGVAKLGIPEPQFFGWAAALSEFLGGILLVLGLGTRVATIFIAITMMVAIFGALASAPFMAKELPIVYVAVMTVLFVAGPGRYSLDHALFSRRATEPRERTTRSIPRTPHGTPIPGRF
jgi:putative oxidoreductase